MKRRRQGSQGLHFFQIVHTRARRWTRNRCRRTRQLYVSIRACIPHLAAVRPGQLVERGVVRNRLACARREGKQCKRAMSWNCVGQPASLPRELRICAVVAEAVSSCSVQIPSLLRHGRGNDTRNNNQCDVKHTRTRNTLEGKRAAHV